MTEEIKLQSQPHQMIWPLIVEIQRFNAIIFRNFFFYFSHSFDQYKPTVKKTMGTFGFTTNE